MQKMVIEWIRPHCFRAFGDCEPIALEDQLTIEISRKVSE